MCKAPAPSCSVSFIAAQENWEYMFHFDGVEELLSRKEATTFECLGFGTFCVGGEHHTETLDVQP